MKIKLFILLFMTVFAFTVFSQNFQRPKLVVGIVVDQMRYDYLYRFNKYYGNEGFNRLMKSGSNFTFTHFNYVPTYTAPGHTSIYTGTTPFYHGIIGNNWYDKREKQFIYCVDDTTMTSIGCNDAEGEKSPRQLLATTITDQLKLATSGESKIISISIKDRAAILPAGHLADGVFWYDENNGNFISSSYYIKALPKWVDNFNAKKLPDAFLSREWSLCRPIDAYKISEPDNSPFENDVFSEGKTYFPHSFKQVKEGRKYEALVTTPYGNELVKELAKSAIVNEKLGHNSFTDFLAISFSSTDFVGHAYGTNSYEIEDIYIRLDEQIADLLKTLDENVGKDNYVLFLTADHGAEETPAILKSLKIPAGELKFKKALDSLKSFAKQNFSDASLIENMSNNQIFLNRDVIKNNNLNQHEVIEKISDFLRNTFPQLASILTRDDLEKLTASRESSNLMLNGYNPMRSGDIVFSLQPGYMANFLERGTSHGASYSYDTHVPLLFYGWHVPQQTVNTPVYIVDIAATICDLIKITEPNGSIGIPLLK